ncbi:hypothetical protein JDS79_45310 [Bacillus cereus]|nr:hypothetical protein [Bacillus cereus]
MTAAAAVLHAEAKVARQDKAASVVDKPKAARVVVKDKAAVADGPDR